jgi:hypothetical protein
MRHRAAISISIALLAIGGSAIASAETIQEDGLRVTFNADFTPHTLPRDKPAPVSVKVEGKVATADGSHPPALRWLEIKLHRSGNLDANGLQTCSAPSLQSTSTATALERCRPALVGKGSFHAAVSLGREIPTGGKILAFNSRRAGRQALVLHLFAGTPVRFTLVVPLTVGRLREGQFGTIMRAKIPKLAGGLGSVTEIDLTIGRRYSFRGERRSYVSAACSAPNSLPGGVFNFARANFRFEGHKAIHPPALLQECSVR